MGMKPKADSAVCREEWKKMESEVCRGNGRYCSVTQYCPTLCGPKDCGPPGSSVHEISQERIVEWVAISYSRGSSQPRD